jgi:hypothetical protein
MYKVRCPSGIIPSDVHGVGQRLNKEILVWHKLDHENIIPLLGITLDFGRDGPMGMVCPWLDNGNLNGYLDRCGAALTLCERFGIVSSEQHLLGMVTDPMLFNVKALRDSRWLVVS